MQATAATSQKFQQSEEKKKFFSMVACTSCVSVLTVQQCSYLLYNYVKMSSKIHESMVLIANYTADTYCVI